MSTWLFQKVPDCFATYLLQINNAGVVAHFCCSSTGTSTAWMSLATTNCWTPPRSTRWPKATKPASAWRTLPATTATTGDLPAPHTPRSHCWKDEEMLIWMALKLLLFCFHINAGLHNVLVAMGSFVLKTPRKWPFQSSLPALKSPSAGELHNIIISVFCLHFFMLSPSG